MGYSRPATVAAYVSCFLTMEPNKAFKRRRRKAVKTQSHQYDAKRYRLRCSCGHERFTGLEENKHSCILCENCKLFGDWTVLAKKPQV